PGAAAGVQDPFDAVGIQSLQHLGAPTHVRIRYAVIGLRVPADATGVVDHWTIGSRSDRRLSKALIASSCCRVMPMSSRPLINRCRVESSSANVASMPTLGAATIRRSTSTVISNDGSFSMALINACAVSSSTTTGTSPDLVALLRKMSPNRDDTTALNP